MIARNEKTPWYVNGDPWVLTRQEWEPEKNIYDETIFTLSNGYMGIRGYTEEVNAGVKSVREGYLAGMFGHIKGDGLKILGTAYPWPAMQMLTLPELFACDIVLDGERFTLDEGEVVFYRRTLNMRNGLLSRHIEWVSPRGRRTRLQFDRFLSAAVPHLAMQQITLSPENWSGKATLNFLLDGATPSLFRCGDRNLPHPPEHLYRQQRIDADLRGVPVLSATIQGTGHRVAIASMIAGEGIPTLQASGKDLGQTVSLDTVAGSGSVTTHAVGVTCSRDGFAATDVPAVAAGVVRDAIKAGFDPALAASTAVWARRWEVSDITIDGPGRDQAYIRFGAFSMLQMAPFHTDTMSIPARAYAFNRYHGLYYWDSETFLLPQYLHTHPDVAEHLLRFRHRTLEGARRTARRLQSDGACYPWMADADDGAEQAPWGIGDYVWHQNADIAYAVDQYVQATGNTRFMAECGLEMLLETARFWLSRVEEDADGVVHLHDTVGPDELDKHGKDNGYTSLMVRRHLRLAARWLEVMRKEYPGETNAMVQKMEVTASESARWLRIADRLAVPDVPGRNFPLQDEFLLAKQPLRFDGMTADEAFAMRHTHRVVKQADIILAMYLLQDEFTVEQMREAYDFYEPMCLHYSSLSYNTHSIIATKIGREGQAYDYFMKAAGLDLDNLRDATKDGLHAAALGGTWQTLVYGFLGMRIEGDTMLLEPRLPEQWKEVRLSLMFRGFRLDLSINHVRHVVTANRSAGGPPARLSINGQRHALEDGKVISFMPQQVG